MSATITGILIDPVAREIRTVTFAADSTLETMRDLLGCAYVDRMGLIPGVDLWIDDEGRVQYPHPGGYFAIGGLTVCGPGLILGVGPDGDSVSAPPGSCALVVNHVEWMDTPPAEDVEPMLMITEWPDE